ncbi:hypothetical protein BGZ83_002177, partial [Gryganskiella cystojenkinii]
MPTTIPTANDASMSSTHHPQSTSAMSTVSSSLPEFTFPSILNPSPVTIREIMLHIGSFLNARSLRNSLCVSKDWYITLYPLLWQRIYLWQDPDEFNPDIGPSFLNLRQHASLVKCLKVYSHEFAVSCGPDPNDGDNPLFFPNLAVLEIDTHYKKPLNDCKILTFMERHQATIMDLTLSSLCMVELTPLLAHELPLLTRLSIKYWDFHGLPSVFMDQYNTLWSRLLSLSLYEFNLFNNAGEQWWTLWETAELLERARPTKLQELVMISDYHRPDLEEIRLQLLLILNSPNLARLVWATACAGCDTGVDEEAEEVEQGPMAQMAGVITSGRFHQGRQQQLESLGLGRSEFRIQDMEIILNSFQTSLKELSLNSTNFGEDSWILIKYQYPRYLSSLTVLDLEGCSLLKGSQVQDILCSVTSLEVFKADYLKRSNLEVDRRSWVCLSLKELSLGFVIQQSQRNCREDDGDRRRGQDLFLDQLSRLSRLKVLLLSKYIARSKLDMENGDEETQEVEKESAIDNAESSDPPYPSATSVDFECQMKLLLTLAFGLDRLKTLRRLRRLEAPKSHLWNDKTNCKTCVWTEVDALWAVENWKGLDELSNIRMTREAKDILEER